MATEDLFLQGKAAWVRVVQLNPWGKWAYQHHFTNNEELEKFRELQLQGVKNELKKDDDGYYTTFSRPREITRRDGSKVILDPPELLDKDGNLLKKDTLIGNGSDVTVKLEVYSHKTQTPGKMAKAARWKALRIDNLVPYETKRDILPDQREAVEGLAEQPPQKLF